MRKVAEIPTRGELDGCLAIDDDDIRAVVHGGAGWFGKPGNRSRGLSFQVQVKRTECGLGYQQTQTLNQPVRNVYPSHHGFARGVSGSS